MASGPSNRKMTRQLPLTRTAQVPRRIALQRMEVETRKPHLARLFSNTESREYQSQAVDVLDLDAIRGPATEEAFQALVPEPRDRHAGV